MRSRYEIENSIDFYKKQIAEGRKIADYRSKNYWEERKREGKLIIDGSTEWIYKDECGFYEEKLAEAEEELKETDPIYRKYKYGKTYNEILGKIEHFGINIEILDLLNYSKQLYKIIKYGEYEEASMWMEKCLVNLEDKLKINEKNQGIYKTQLIDNMLSPGIRRNINRYTGLTQKSIPERINFIEEKIKIIDKSKHWVKNGLCRFCGGKIGIFSKKCTVCEKKQ